MSKEDEDEILWEAGHRSWVEKGRFLNDFGRVWKQAPRAWSVLGIHKFYAVTQRSNRPADRDCTCIGFAKRGGCSHLAAVHFFIAAGN